MTKNNDGKVWPDLRKGTGAAVKFFYARREKTLGSTVLTKISKKQVNKKVSAAH